MPFLVDPPARRVLTRGTGLHMARQRPYDNGHVHHPMLPALRIPISHLQLHSVQPLHYACLPPVRVLISQGPQIDSDPMFSGFKHKRNVDSKGLGLIGGLANFECLNGYCKGYEVG